MVDISVDLSLGFFAGAWAGLGTYAPVTAMQTLRVFWATCAHFGLKIRQLDLSKAFLHAP